MYNLSPEAQYEIARARAGNVLFCPAFASRGNTFSGLVPLPDESAQLLRLLLSSGIRSTCADYEDAIEEIGCGLKAAIAHQAGHTHCAEYLLYRLEGIPDPNDDARRVARLQAIIGTFYANLLIAGSIAHR